MTFETLKKLIDREFNRFDTIPEIHEGVEYLLSVYEKEMTPDYTRPFPYLCSDTSGIPDKVPYGTICPCNPANGGSGICGCIMGNQMVENPAKYGQPKTNFASTGSYISKDFPPGTKITNTNTNSSIKTTN